MKLGSGSFGSVTRCRKTGYVTKKYNDRAINSAVREIGILRYLGQHPNVVQLIKVKQDSIVLEYGGQSLRDYFRAPNPANNNTIINDILAGLQYIHDSGTLHRDIKPENILWNGTNAILCDLGVARIGADNLTYQRAAYSYCAPEICLCNYHYDAGIDIWAMACVIAEVENGIVLFNENDIRAASEVKDSERYANLDEKLQRLSPLLPAFTTILWDCFATHGRPTIRELCEYYEVTSIQRRAKRYQYYGHINRTQQRAADIATLKQLVTGCSRAVEVFCLSVSLYDEIKYGAIIEDYVQKPMTIKAGQSKILVTNIFNLAAIYYQVPVKLSAEDVAMIWTLLGWNLQLEQTLACHIGERRDLEYYAATI